MTRDKKCCENQAVGQQNNPMTRDEKSYENQAVAQQYNRKTVRGGAQHLVAVARLRRATGIRTCWRRWSTWPNARSAIRSTRQRHTDQRSNLVRPAVRLPLAIQRYTALSDDHTRLEAALPGPRSPPGCASHIPPRGHDPTALDLHSVEPLKTFK